MSKIDVKLIRKLREKTSAGVMDCRKALLEAGGDLEKAQKILFKKGLDKAKKKAERLTGDGLVEAYVHATGKLAALVELQCETDFVARTKEFKTLALEIAMQAASMNPEDVDALLKMEYIRDSSKTIDGLIKEAVVKLGENIKIARFSRLKLGE